MSFVFFLTTLLGFIFIGLFVWLITVIFQEGPKPQDYTIVDNFMPQHTNGFSQGILLNVEMGDERNGYTFVPKDIDYYGRKKNKNMAKIESQTIYVDKRKAISFSRSTWSGERNRLWLLPPNPEDLPEEMKRTEFGKIAMEMINNINANKTEIDSIREGSDRVKAIIERQGDGETSEKEFERLDSAHDNLIKHMNRGEEKKPTFGGSSSSSNV